MKIIRTDGEGKKRLDNLLKNTKNQVGKVGWLNREAYPTGIKVAYVAAIQEFGSAEKKIPSRPFIRFTINTKKAEWRKLIEKGSEAILKGSYTSKDVLEAVGLRAAADIKKTIATAGDPPIKGLKDSTIKARLRRRADKKTIGNLTKPLIDTGYLLNNITNTVEDE